MQWRHLLDTTVFFYPIFDHHIYTGQIQYILDTIFGCNIASTLSHQNAERWVFFSIFFLLWCFKHAGIGVDLRDCFAKRSTIRFLSHLHDKWYILTIIHYCFKHSFLDTVFSVTLIYFKNNLCQAIFILFKCFKHVYYFCISKDFLVISVYYKCFAGLFYRNDVLISIVTVPKTIHIVMGFFYHCVTQRLLLWKDWAPLTGSVISYGLCIFFKSVCIKSASRHSVIHVFFY